MYSPFGSEMAKAHIDDLHRDADADRMTKGIGAERSAKRRARVHSWFSVLLSPIRGLSRPRSEPVSLPEPAPAPVDALEPTPVEARVEDVAPRVAPSARSPLLDPADDPLAEDERRARRHSKLR